MSFTISKMELAKKCNVNSRQGGGTASALDSARAAIGPSVRFASQEGFDLWALHIGLWELAIGVLLALMVVRPAKADSFSFSFTPNPTECAKGWSTPCTDFGSGTLTVAPPQNDPFTMEPCRSRR